MNFNITPKKIILIVFIIVIIIIISINANKKDSPVIDESAEENEVAYQGEYEIITLNKSIDVNEINISQPGENPESFESIENNNFVTE